MAGSNNSYVEYVAEDLLIHQSLSIRTTVVLFLVSNSHNNNKNYTNL